MQTLRAILNAGTGYATTASARRGIFLANAISLIVAALSVILALLYFGWYGHSPVTYLIPAIGVLSAVVMLLNHHGFIQVSRIWISFVPPLLVLILSVYSKRLYYDRQEELDYFTFRIVMLGTCVVPLVVFSLKERWSLLLAALAGLALLMLHDPVHIAFDVPYQQDKLKAYNYYFTNIVLFVTYLMLVGSLTFLKWISEQHESRNVELITDLNRINTLLADRNEEIEAQHAELLAQSDTLSANQLKLMEANAVIEQHRSRLLSENRSLESELLEKNSDLTEANTELIKHNNELRQFSHTVSHNLRGPVASLLGLVELVDMNKLTEGNRQALNYIGDSANQLDQIIRDLGKIIDIRQDIFKIRQSIDLRREVKEIKTILKKELTDHGAEVRLELDACPSIYSVRPMVHSILYNLFSNAIKYRSFDTAPVIAVKAREEEDCYTLEVTDNGLGIDLEKNRESLFKLYKRFHFHTEGKGLGLYLVRLQAEALGGNVTVESELNRYTRFIVRLQRPANIERQVLFAEDHAEIFFDARINATGVIWKGPLTSEQYRNVFTKCLEFVRTYNTPSYISDMTHQGTIAAEDQAWMLREILPPAIENGLRRIAAIRADIDDPLASQYLSDIIITIRTLGAEQQFFPSFDQAFDWIQKENEKATLSVPQ
jgi:signal transduction histidine kinase